MTAASSGMSPVAALSHRFNGLEGIRILKALDDQNKSDGVAALGDHFRQIHEALLAAPRQYLLIDEEERLEQQFTGFELYWKPHQPAPGFVPYGAEAVSKTVNQMWVTNTQVNFCARAYPTVSMCHPDAAALSVLGGFMRNGFLHTAIREQGGAYGGGAGHDHNISAFRFFSYRDPRMGETLEDFDRAIDWVLDKDHEWRQVEESILGVIGNIDKPGSPAGEARQAFHNALHGRNRDILQQFREAVLNVTLQDLRRVTETWLQPGKASTAIVTSAAALERVGDMGMEVIKL
jgi:Zn-dependent M16 (insulinase) family peptidase